MAELPSGTVTFLFTDIEGSTRLVKQLGERYGDVLVEHQRLLRRAFAEFGGQEIDTQGDAFFVAFRRARDAALAAIAAQRTLGAHDWPVGVELRVRMGIHTGEPAQTEERYHGLGVHRAARIMAAGHGGQILVSQATCSVLGDDELPETELRDLGEHRLKDLDRPERIFQLVAEGLPDDFRPLRTEEAPTAYTGLEDGLAEAAQVAVTRSRIRRHGRLIAVGAVLVAAGIGSGLILALRSGSAEALVHVDANAVGLINPKTGRIADQVPVGATPSHLAVGQGAVWVTNADAHSVSRIDPTTHAVGQTIQVGNGPTGVVVARGAVWVVNGLDGTVSRIDPTTSTVVQRINVGNGPVGIAYAEGSIWVANTGDSTITKIDADSGKPTRTLPIAATELAFGAGTLWATESAAGLVARIDPTTGNIVQTIHVGNGPAGIAFGRGAAWVANSLDGTVSRIDPSTNQVAAVTPTGNGPVAIAVGSGLVWVSNKFGGTLAVIDPRTNQVTRRIDVGNRPQGIAIANGTVLVAVRQSGAGHRGGTLTARMGDVDSIDTAIAYETSSWPILRMTNDGLVAFNQASGLQGTQLVPNLAVSLPTPTDGGRTYTFRLRPDIRYSNGRPIRASDVRSTFERDFKIAKFPGQFYDGIVGANRCEKNPKRCDLSRGIVTDDATKTVAFHLAAPDPEFLDKLALPFAYLVPAGTPTRDTRAHPLPATGPYMIASYRRNHVLRLVRNPYFHEWSKAAQPDGYPDVIAVAIGGKPDKAVADVIHGKADMFSSPQFASSASPDHLAAIATRQASQVHTNPQPATVGLFLNTRVAPFNRLDVRRAVNYAADRAEAAQVDGGPDFDQPTCQILPPNFQGYRPYCPYTAGRPTDGTWTAPDLAKAQALIAHSGTRGMKITYWGGFNSFDSYAVKLLRSLGYRVSLKVLPSSGGGIGYFSVVADSRVKAQIGGTAWIADYPAASNFFNAQFTCASFLPNSRLNQNASEFCDPRVDRQIKQALAAQATSPDAARGLWERVDRKIVDQAAWVPLVNPKEFDVLAKRVGNYQYSPAGMGMLIDQLWVR